jgi:hypothetical protein
MMSNTMKWEPVIALYSYYDGPRSGVAMCSGEPCVFESEFSEVEDNYTNRFFVMSIDRGLVPLIQEGWEIWLRWCHAFHRGEVTIETHPALEQDRSRNDEIQMAIGHRLTIVRDGARLMKAKFRLLKPSKCWDGAEVTWISTT